MSDQKLNPGEYFSKRACSDVGDLTDPWEIVKKVVEADSEDEAVIAYAGTETLANYLLSAIITGSATLDDYEEGTWYKL